MSQMDSGKVREVTLQYKNGYRLRDTSPRMDAENVPFIEKSAYDSVVAERDGLKDKINELLEVRDGYISGMDGLRVYADELLLHIKDRDQKVNELKAKLEGARVALNDAQLNVRSVYMNAEHGRLKQAEELHRDAIKDLRKALKEIE